ncbi:MAG: tRNA pseudouridine(38-40) synthase TruA [Minwuiales bacterium]|nr:tRNA pseudouridine(38-40) synthase TruA [Minwuiales bacterium]
MIRYKLIVEYDGGDFVGWQRQTNGRSVQAAIEDAVFAFCGERVTVQGAGRTDSGVHALGQAAHMDLVKDAPPDTVMAALNQHLKPAPVAVLACEQVDDDFHARFSATARHYVYRIVNRRAPLTVDRGRAWRVGKPLDAEAMHAAAQVLVGHHDFSSFRAAECQAKSPTKTLDRLDVTRHGDRIAVETSARSFLHHQVRAMVGTLALVGEGKWDTGDVEAALAARDRSAAGPNAPAEGLYLTRVDYG